MRNDWSLELVTLIAAVMMSFAAPALAEPLIVRGAREIQVGDYRLVLHGADVQIDGNKIELLGGGSGDTPSPPPPAGNLRSQFAAAVEPEVIRALSKDVDGLDKVYVQLAALFRQSAAAGASVDEVLALTTDGIQRIGKGYLVELDPTFQKIQALRLRTVDDVAELRQAWAGVADGIEAALRERQRLKPVVWETR